MRRLVGWAAMLASGTLGAAGAHAADRRVQMRVPAPIRTDVAAMPLIAQPADDAEQRINTALQRLDTTLRKALVGCKGAAGASPYWTRTVDVPMRGPGFLSVVITDDAYCGGAHPSVATMAIVYDLRTGAPVDWTRLLPPPLTGTVALASGMDGTRMVTLASKRLHALFLAGYDPGGDSAEDQAACRDAVREPGDGGPPAMMVWPDAKAGGLALQFDLPHAIQVCAAPVVVPVAALREEAVQPALLDAIEAAHAR